MERVRFADIRRRISWGSVIGGVVTVLAISILLAILATSISFFMLDPASDSPASGIGTNIGIWTVVALILSFACGGFVAGKLAGSDGFIHGFLVWATTTIITLLLVIWMASGAVKLAGNMLGSVASVAGHVVSGVGSAVGSGISAGAEGVESIFGNIDLGKNNPGEIRQDIRRALRKSGVKEFQPEYLQTQMKSIRSDLQRSVKTLVMNPKDADVIINRFLDRVETRTENAFRDVDRNDINRAIANNTNMTQDEVNRAADEYIDIYNNMRDEAREQINNLQQNIEQAKQDWEEFKVNAGEEANSMANAAGRSALWSFFGLLAGGIICAFVGHFGTRKSQEGYEA